MGAASDKPAKERSPSDVSVLAHIERLVAEEHRLYGQQALSAAESDRLKKIGVELDQCWDLLRQRRAVLETGIDAGNAVLRLPEVVERYTG